MCEDMVCDKIVCLSECVRIYCMLNLCLRKYGMCVWNYCMLNLCVWSSGMCVSAGGGGRRRNPGYRIKNKNPTPHKVAGKKTGKHQPFSNQHALQRFPMFFKDSHLWSLLDRYNKKKDLGQIDHFFFKNTLLFTKLHLRSLLDSKPGWKLLLFKIPCSYILEVPGENFDGKIWWKSVFFNTACPGNIFQNTMSFKISDFKRVLERMEFLAMLVHLRNFWFFQEKLRESLQRIIF